MGECHCSNITIMQLFHELKQQFPALPDHVVSQCIAQNSHDRETCARSLRATQESRPSPGAFPPPAPCTGVQQSLQQQLQQLRGEQQSRRYAMNQRGAVATGNATGHPPRPASLDIGMARRCPLVGYCTTRTSVAAAATAAAAAATVSSSAPAACASRGFFDDCTVVNSGNSNNNSTPDFELSVNVACSPAGNRDFRTVPTIGACKRSDLVVVPRPHYAEPPLAIRNTGGAQIDYTRSYTSVSLTLRPPSSEPQAPIDIRSEGSSLTYSTSSLDPRGFQSRLQISIGPGNVGSVAAARIRPPVVSNRPVDPVRPNSLIPPTQMSPQRPPGLPPESPIQLPTTVSAPTTPSTSSTMNIVQSCSLPTTPCGPSTSGASPSVEKHIQTDRKLSPSSYQVTEHQRVLIQEQLIRKERLAKELMAEKGRLEALKKELQMFARLQDPLISSQELKRNLKSDIYQLQVECKTLAKEVDQRSCIQVPLGETNEEFYQGIYTGQPLPARPPTNLNPPPLPSQPPAWRLEHSTIAIDNDSEERDGPSWVCTMCTFDNHPLMTKCEECDMPRLLNDGGAGETQDIHIRVTHHHNFSPRHTVHSWVI